MLPRVVKGLVLQVVVPAAVDPASGHEALPTSTSSGPFFRFYTALQIIAFTITLSALLLVGFVDGGVGSLKGFGFFLVLMLSVGFAAGVTARTLGLALGVFVSTPFFGAIISYVLLILPTILGIAGKGLIAGVDGPFAREFVLIVLSLGPGFVATVFGYAVRGIVGVPED